MNLMRSVRRMFMLCAPKTIPSSVRKSWLHMDFKQSWIFFNLSGRQIFVLGQTRGNNYYTISYRINIYKPIMMSLESYRMTERFHMLQNVDWLSHNERPNTPWISEELQQRFPTGLYYTRGETTAICYVIRKKNHEPRGAHESWLLFARRPTPKSIVGVRFLFEAHLDSRKWSLTWVTKAIRAIGTSVSKKITNFASSLEINVEFWIPIDFILVNAYIKFLITCFFFKHQ